MRFLCVVDFSFIDGVRKLRQLTNSDLAINGKQVASILQLFHLNSGENILK